MSEPGAGGPDGVTRPDHEPTINEAGLEVFAIDGTDSFAVPGPADGQPTGGGTVPPAISPLRILVTAGAVLAGLVFVVAVGAGSPGDASLRTDGEGAGPGFATPLWRTADGEEPDLGAVRLQPYDDETLAQLEEGSTDDELGRAELDDEYSYDDRYRRAPVTTAPTETVEPFDDDDIGSFDDDDDFTYRPSYTVPRRVTPTRRSVVTVPRRVTTRTTTTTTTVPTTTTSVVTTTTAATTTTVAATTTSSSTTTTTLAPPAPAWESVTTQGLPPACTSFRLRSLTTSLVAVADGAWFRSTNDGIDWTNVGSINAGPTRAIADPVAGADDVFWFATDAGVFDHTGAQVPGVALPGARSLAARVDGTGATLLAVSDAGVSRWSGGAWGEPDSDPAGPTLGSVRFLPSGDALLGADGSVLRSIDGGLSWTPVPTPGQVAGEAVVAADGAIGWLVDGGRSVIRSTNLGASWTPVAAPAGVVFQSLTVSPGGALLAVSGSGGVFAASGTGGWEAFEPAPQGVIGGVTRSPSGTSLLAHRPVCGADSVLRLADP